MYWNNWISISSEKILLETDISEYLQDGKYTSNSMHKGMSLMMDSYEFSQYKMFRKTVVKTLKDDCSYYRQHSFRK